MSLQNVNRKSGKAGLARLRRDAASVGIFSIAELARRVGCSRESIYFSLEKPSRFPRVTKRIKELTHG